MFEPGHVIALCVLAFGVGVMVGLLLATWMDDWIERRNNNDRSAGAA